MGEEIKRLFESPPWQPGSAGPPMESGPQAPVLVTLWALSPQHNAVIGLKHRRRPDALQQNQKMLNVIGQW